MFLSLLPALRIQDLYAFLAFKRHGGKDRDFIAPLVEGEGEFVDPTR
jgi:hypothetical protein